MKVSIILGVIHMCVGICLKAANSHLLKMPLDFYFEFLPQFLFMLSFFGYMVFEIFYKWTIPVIS